jgi:hypothetical protein
VSVNGGGNWQSVNKSKKSEKRKPMVEFTAENCIVLAQKVVDGMDLKDLCRTMTEIIEEILEKDEDLFQEEWKRYFEDVAE